MARTLVSIKKRSFVKISANCADSVIAMTNITAVNTIPRPMMCFWLFGSDPDGLLHNYTPK